MFILHLKQSFELGFQFSNLEGESHDFVVLMHGAFGVLGAQITGELTVVQLADHNLFVLP